MYLTMKYNFEGCKNQQEKEYFEGIAVDLYNSVSGDISVIYSAGFNLLIDTLKERGVDFKGTWNEPVSEGGNPAYEELYDIFMRGIYREAAKKYLLRYPDGCCRILVLNGIDSVHINQNTMVATINGRVEDYKD